VISTAPGLQPCPASFREARRSLPHSCFPLLNIRRFCGLDSPPPRPAKNLTLAYSRTHFTDIPPDLIKRECYHSFVSSAFFFPTCALFCIFFVMSDWVGPPNLRPMISSVVVETHPSPLACPFVGCFYT